jgi:hypothetical protein
MRKVAGDLEERRESSLGSSQIGFSKSREALFHLWIIFGEANQHTDAAHRFGLLRQRNHRPRRSRATNQTNKFPPPHVCPLLRRQHRIGSNYHLIEAYAVQP